MMGWPADAYLPGSKRRVGDVLGNAVCPQVLQWLCALVRSAWQDFRRHRQRSACQPPAAHGVGPRGLLPLQPAVLQTPLSLCLQVALRARPRPCGADSQPRRYNSQAEGVRAYLRHKQGVQVRVGGSSLVLFRAAALRLPSARSPTAVCISSTALSTARGDADRPMPLCAAGRGFVDPAVPDGKGASIDSTCAVRRVLQPRDRASMKAARAALEG